MTHGLLQLPLPTGILLGPVPSQNRDLSPCSRQSEGTSASLEIYNEYGKVRKVPGSKPSPLPRGEGGTRPAPSPADAGRVRGYLRRQAKLFCPAESSQGCYTLLVRIPTQRVRELRRNQTEAEKAAWYVLRGRRVGAKFRRQCRIENWVVDFYCSEYRLAIELDGGVHSQPSQMRKDATKEDYLRTLGISLLRIPNGLVLEDAEEFVRRVREAIEGRMGQMTPR